MFFGCSYEYILERWYLYRYYRGKEVRKERKFERKEVILIIYLEFEFFEEIEFIGKL